MSAPTTMQRVGEFLAERRRLGFQAHKSRYILISFARYADRLGSPEPLTVEHMAEWARQDKWKRGTPEVWARRLKLLRPFARWLRQFEPRTEVPNESIFGPVPGRVTPHIYREDEIVELLAAARQLNPQGGLRPPTFETLFGLIASAGLRVSEALTLRDANVDLKAGTLTVRQSKFAKSRLLPLHPSTVDALARYRRLRSRQVRTTVETPFFVGTRGQRLGQPLGERQVHRVFIELRDQLGWVDRGAHGGPRIHDLRHSFAVRRVMLWHEQGIDVDQAMLALSTYLGHAKISNTYWYLTGVPELMALAGAKFACFAEAPEAGDEQAEVEIAGLCGLAVHPQMETGFGLPFAIVRQLVSQSCEWRRSMSLSRVRNLSLGDSQHGTSHRVRKRAARCSPHRASWQPLGAPCGLGQCRCARQASLGGLRQADRKP